MRAAFFQGHVELLGLTPEGKKTAPAVAGNDDLVKVPPVVHTPHALAVLTGSSADTIMAANPGLPVKGPLPAKLHVPGCRYHRVVEAVEKAPAPASRQIARPRASSRSRPRTACPSATSSGPTRA